MSCLHQEETRNRCPGNVEEANEVKMRMRTEKDTERRTKVSCFEATGLNSRTTTARFLLGISYAKELYSTRLSSICFYCGVVRTETKRSMKNNQKKSTMKTRTTEKKSLRCFSLPNECSNMCTVSLLFPCDYSSPKQQRLKKTKPTKKEIK